MAKLSASQLSQLTQAPNSGLSFSDKKFAQARAVKATPMSFCKHIFNLGYLLWGIEY